MDEPKTEGKDEMATDAADSWVVRVRLDESRFMANLSQSSPFASKDMEITAGRPQPQVRLSKALRDHITALQQKSVTTCGPSQFAEVEIPAPLVASACPELVFEDLVDAVSAAESSSCRALPSPQVPPSMGGSGHETLSAASSPVPRSLELRYPTRWSARLKSRRWWFDLSWNLASVVAMVVIALVVRNWLFNSSPDPDADLRRLPVVNSELATTSIEPDATPRTANLQEPASRITDLIPMEQDNEIMTGPLTEGAFGEYQSQPDGEGRGLEVMGVMR
ncbi:MAG: hypothetical protein VX084_12165 [Planctomycetota bacterium]|nr:hypothetical protein [Planctomycetota bacterium]